MERYRVYELARELNTNSKRLMEKFAEIEIFPKNHMSLLEDNVVEALYKHIGIKVKAPDSAHTGPGQPAAGHPPREAEKTAQGAPGSSGAAPPKGAHGGAAAAQQAPSAKSEVKSEAKSDVKSEAKSDVKSEAKSDAKSAGGSAEKAEKGVSAAEKGVTAAEKGVTATEKGVTAAERGTPVSDKGVSAAEKGVTAAEKGVTVAEKAISVAEKSVTAAEKGIPASEKGAPASDKGIAAPDKPSPKSAQNQRAGANAQQGAGAPGKAAANAGKGDTRAQPRDAKDGRDAKAGAAAPAKGAKDQKNAPRIIRTTEINLDRSARDEKRDGGRQQSGWSQQGAGREGDRGGRRDRDRDRRRRDYDRSEYYKPPDSNSGLIAGFTRMTREESMKQLLEEARAQQKRAALNAPEKDRLPEGAGAPAGRAAQDSEAAKSERAARIDRLTRIDAVAKAGIADEPAARQAGADQAAATAATGAAAATADISGAAAVAAKGAESAGPASAAPGQAAGLPAAQDVSQILRAAEKSDRETKAAEKPIYGIETVAGQDAAPGAKAAERQQPPAAAIAVADESAAGAAGAASAAKAGDGAAGPPKAGEGAGAAKAGAARPQEGKPQQEIHIRVEVRDKQDDSGEPAKPAAKKGTAQETPRPETPRLETQRQEPGRPAEARRDDRARQDASRLCGDRQDAGRQGGDRPGGDRQGGDRRPDAARTDSARTDTGRADSTRTQDGRSRSRASFDGRPYQQQDQGRAQTQGQDYNRSAPSRQPDGRQPADGRPRTEGRPQPGAYPQQGQGQGGDRRDGRPFAGTRDDRPFRPRDDRGAPQTGDRQQFGDRRPSDGRQSSDGRGYQPRDAGGRPAFGDRPRSDSRQQYDGRPQSDGRSYSSQGGARQGFGARTGPGAGPRTGAGGAMGDRRPATGDRRPAAAGDRWQGGAGGRTRGDTTKAPGFARSDETVAIKSDQKRVYASRDTEKGVKKDLKRDSAKPAPATPEKGRRFKPQASIIGEKKGVQAFTDDEFIINEFYDATDESKRSRRQQRQRKILRREKYIPPRAILTSVTIAENLTVKELAEALKKTASDVISKLMGLGMAATINQVLDFETAALVAAEFSIAAEKEIVVKEEDILFDDSETEDDDGLVTRPPVVVVMGHVDHGKTSLLDAIRKTNVIAGEAGGITQHIGAYMVNIKGRAITFLDTPGHEAFTSMRARGAMVTDIAILVVSAVDGVMPQTIEAINHAKAANVSIIVAINMFDREGANNPERVKQELTEYGLVVEEWGGDVIAVPVSAKTGENVEQLLEMILLTADMLELRVDPNRQAKGTVIEAKLDKNRGPVATVLIQRGTLSIGDTCITGATVGRIRAMLDDNGNSIQKAGPSTPVEIIGLSEVPEAGEVFYVTTDDKVTKSLAEKRRLLQREESLRASSRVTLDDLYSQIQEGKVKELNLIIKADVQGSVEAVRQSVEKLGNGDVRVNIIHSGVGAINDSDINLASVSNAIIIGFNVRPGGASVIEAAELMGIDIRLYTVIYNAIEDIQAAMKGLLDPTFREVVLGHVEVRQIFRASGVGTIGGCYVLDGKIQRNNSVRILRDGVSIFDGKLASLRRFKDDAREVLQGFECGIAIERFNDIKENDIIEPYMMEEIPVV